MTPPCIYPTLRYRNADAAIDWLITAAGFHEHAVYRDDSGIVMHAELALGSSIIMLGQARPGAYADMAGPVDTPRTDAIYVAVADADDLFARMTAAGTQIVQPPYQTDYGSREFACRDPEGNLWSFGTYWPSVGQISPEG